MKSMNWFTDLNPTASRIPFNLPVFNDFPHLFKVTPSASCTIDVWQEYIRYAVIRVQIITALCHMFM